MIEYITLPVYDLSPDHHFNQLSPLYLCPLPSLRPTPILTRISELFSPLECPSPHSWPEQRGWTLPALTKISRSLSWAHVPLKLGLAVLFAVASAVPRK